MEKCSDHKEGAANAILAFDTLYTTNHMQILKLLLPYLNQEQQKTLAIFIKWNELIFTMNFLKQYSAVFCDPSKETKKELKLNEIFPLLLPYCSKQEKNLLSQFSQMQNMMDKMEEMQQYMPFLQQFMSAMSGDGSSGSGTGSDNMTQMMDMLKGMMSEEQQAMFSMFMKDNN